MFVVCSSENEVPPLYIGSFTGFLDALRTKQIFSFNAEILQDIISFPLIKICQLIVDSSLSSLPNFLEDSLITINYAM